MRRVGTVMLVCAVAVSLAVSAAFLLRADGPEPAAALPEAVEAIYGPVVITSRDGKELEMPEAEVTCVLVALRSKSEGIYDCPAPYDLDDLLSKPLAAAPGSIGRSELAVFVRAFTRVSGLPANSWQTVRINYGTTLSSPVVVIGEELEGGESGHIENTSSPRTSRGVFGSYFYYRAQTNGDGAIWALSGWL